MVYEIYSNGNIRYNVLVVRCYEHTTEEERNAIKRELEEQSGRLLIVVVLPYQFQV